MSMANIAAIFGVIGVITLIAMAWAVVDYVLSSIAFFTVARRRRISNAWMAWVPILRFWALGGICDHYDSTRGFKRSWRKILLTLTIVVVGCGVIFEIVTIAQTVSLTLTYEYSNYVDVFTVIGSLAGVYAMLIVMIIVASALSVCQMICQFKFFESCRPDDAVKFLLLSLLVPFASPFCLFSCRNYDLGLPQQPDVNEQLPPAGSAQ